jgi:hypothetical protein
MKSKKSWADRMKKPPHPEVKILEKGFGKWDEGSKMLIPTPALIATYLKHSTPGNRIEISQMRKDLAAEAGADFTCPLTTGLFLRVVTEYANEQRESGICKDALNPVWRIVRNDLPMWKKLTFETGWLTNLQKAEEL